MEDFRRGGGAPFSPKKSKADTNMDEKNRWGVGPLTPPLNLPSGWGPSGSGDIGRRSSCWHGRAGLAGGTSSLGGDHSHSELIHTCIKDSPNSVLQKGRFSIRAEWFYSNYYWYLFISQYRCAGQQGALQSYLYIHEGRTLDMGRYNSLTISSQVYKFQFH